MSLIIPPGFLQCVYEHQRTGDAEPMLTTCGHELDSASGANNQDAADDLALAWETEMVSGFSGQTTFIGTTVYIGQDGGPPLVLTSSRPPAAGPNSNNLLPQNCALFVRKRTDAAGRRGRGRMYIPEVAEGDVTDLGALSTTYQSAWQARVEGWMAALTTAVGARYYPPVVLHRTEGIGVEPPPTPITAFTVADRIATQRRRLRP